MNRFFIIYSYLTLLSGAILGIVVFVWLMFPYNPLVFNDEKFTVMTPVVHRGKSVQYISDYCKIMPLPALLTRTFTNGIIYSTPSIITNRPPGCNTIVIEAHVPDEIPLGTYHIENTYEFKVNPIRTVVVSHETEDFTVIE